MLKEKSDDLTVLESRLKVFNNKLIKIMNDYDKTMTELEKELETDFDNAIKKMMSTTALFRPKYDLINKKIAALEYEYSIENDKYMKIMQELKYILCKC